jgi:hypothetical protein
MIDDLGAQAHDSRECEAAPPVEHKRLFFDETSRAKLLGATDQATEQATDQ